MDVEEVCLHDLFVTGIDHDGFLSVVISNLDRLLLMMIMMMLLMLILLLVLLLPFVLVVAIVVGFIS